MEDLEELEERFRLLNEATREFDKQRQHAQVQEEEHLKQSVKAYEMERDTLQKDIDQKEQALNKSKEALATRKRAHDAEVATINQKISKIKRFKQSNAGTPSEAPQLPASSNLRLNSGQHALEKPIEAQLDQDDVDDVYHSSHVDEPSDEDSTAQRSTFIDPGIVSSTQGSSQNLSSTNKTIAFDDVYKLAQDPDAESKHWIVEKGGNWYILRCKEHHLNWGKEPVKSSKLHLTSKFHGCSNRDNLAFEELGELVVGCDQEKARLSNDEYQKALKQGYIPNGTMNKPQQALFKPFTRSGQELLEGVIDPVVGEVYHGWWDDSKTWFSVVILPHLGDGDWKEVGIAGKLLSSELTIPNCFKKVKADSGEEVKLTWAEGYEDGGRKVCSRQFPCLWLHNPLKVPPADQDLRLEDIPQAHVLTFVAAKDLRHPPTILPQDDLDMMRVFAYQRLAHDWKARLKAIQANKNPTPGQKTAYTVRDLFSLPILLVAINTAMMAAETDGILIRVAMGSLENHKTLQASPSLLQREGMGLSGA